MRIRRATPRTVAALVLATVLLETGCRSSSTAGTGAKPPAQVATEDGLVTITLTPDAVHRLGIATTAVATRPIRRQRTTAGELLLPLAHADGHVRSVFGLLPTMTATELIHVAELQVDADGLVAAAEVQLGAAKLALARAEQLVDSKAGTRRAVDEARTQLQLADATLVTAREKRTLLGVPVFDAVRSGVLWARVSVYAGDLDDIDRQAAAMVEMLGAPARATPIPAAPVPIPLSAGSSATADLFYELQNAGDSLKPGQRVRVAVPLKGSGDALVVPRTAVLYDVNGGAWIYVQSDPQTFSRRRVEVRWMDDDAGAVLARGPASGTAVVTDGATELFGIEFGSGK